MALVALAEAGVITAEEAGAAIVPYIGEALGVTEYEAAAVTEEHAAQAGVGIWPWLKKALKYGVYGIGYEVMDHAVQEMLKNAKAGLSKKINPPAQRPPPPKKPPIKPPKIGDPKNPSINIQIQNTNSRGDRDRVLGTGNVNPRAKYIKHHNKRAKRMQNFLPPVFPNRKRTRTGRKIGHYRKVGHIARKFQGELKHQDLAISSTSIPVIANIPATWGQLCSPISLGTSMDSARIGRKIKLKSIHLKGVLTRLASAGTTAPGAAVVTIYCILDRQANGAAAAVTDVFTSTNVRGAFVNLANSQRFKVIRKLTYEMNQAAAGGNVGGTDTNWSDVDQHVEWYKKCSIPILYSEGAGGAITDVMSNNVFFIVGLNNSGADAEVVFNGGVMIRS
jgi:hypothetical protein